MVIYLINNKNFKIKQYINIKKLIPTVTETTFNKAGETVATTTDNYHSNSKSTIKPQSRTGIILGPYCEMWMPFNVTIIVINNKCGINFCSMLTNFMHMSCFCMRQPPYKLTLLIVINDNDLLIPLNPSCRLLNFFYPKKFN